MNQQQILEKVQERFGEAVLGSDLETLEPFVQIDPEKWAEVALFLRDGCGLNYLACLTGIDRGKGEGLEAVYNLEHMGSERYGIAIRVKVPYDTPDIPTVESVWRTADWHEREAYDLLGFNFVGHHNLVRILCAEDWEGHPLRKDYKSPDYYHGVRNNVV